ncbi:MAG: hypothetical protein JXR73_05390 [Candidatus Omnitrophica bacterium]|nr:hypothetical protein [Candidatus Omnitrophota bacterium]
MKKSRLIALFFAGVLGFCFANSVYAQEPSQRELELEKTVKELLQRVAELESREEKRESAQKTLSEQVQKSQETKENPNEVKTTWKNGLNFESADGANSVQIGGRVQNDWYAGSIDNGDFPDGTRFRRIWLKVGGKLFDDFNYKIQYDLAGNGIARWKDIYLEYTALDFMNIRAGLFKEPFSMEELMFNRDLTFLERASLNALVPSRNTGFMVYNDILDNRLRWEIGVFKTSNDFGDGEEDDADNGDWDASMRVSGLPWYEDGGEKLLHLGAAFSHREWSDDLMRLRSRGGYSRGDRLVDTGSFNAETADLIGAELGLNYGPFNFMSEYVLTNVDAVGAGSDNYDSFYV